MMEMVIVIIFLSIIILININLISVNSRNNIYLNEIELLNTYLNNAKNKAILSRSNVYIGFDKKRIVINDNNNKEEYDFKSICFETNYSMYFNAKGNANQAKTIVFKNNYVYKKIVFYIGKGWYKIE